MSTFTFELHAFSNRREVGFKGSVGPLGEVTAARQKAPAKESRRNSNYSCVTVTGEQFPEIVYRGIGSGRPSLQGARISVDGALVEISLNKKVLTKQPRALHLTHRQRNWTYTALRLNQESVLERPGVKVSLTQGRSSTGKGTSSFGVASTAADGLDLALAILFESVNMDLLTTAGAISSALNRILTPRSNKAFTPGE